MVGHVAQCVEQWSVEPKVAGSIPVMPTILSYFGLLFVFMCEADTLYPLFLINLFDSRKKWNN